jgi:phage gp45-like
MIRGIVESITEGLIKLFSASGRTGESFEGREYFQHYGFTSRPLPGAELIIIREGNHILGIASDDRRYRIALEEGEMAIYTDEGDKVHLKRGKIIDVICGNKLNAVVTNEVDITTKVAKIAASTSCDITSPAVTVNASTSVIVNAPAIQLGGSSGTMRAIIDERIMALYNDHTHGSDSKPVTKLTSATVCTTISKAG